jgi:hypothetical protein
MRRQEDCEHTWTCQNIYKKPNNALPVCTYEETVVARVASSNVVLVHDEQAGRSQGLSSAEVGLAAEGTGGAWKVRATLSLELSTLAHAPAAAYISALTSGVVAGAAAVAVFFVLRAKN